MNCESSLKLLNHVFHLLKTHILIFCKSNFDLRMILKKQPNYVLGVKRDILYIFISTS
jgi:hypothetical protein